MIYDITQPLFSCAVFPGDPAPKRDVLADMQKGDVINLTAISMCSHNGTHVDAPAHFIKDGKTVDQLDLSVFVGDCYVARHEGDVTAEDALRILDHAVGGKLIGKVLDGPAGNERDGAHQGIAVAGGQLLGNLVHGLGSITYTVADVL